MVRRVRAGESLRDVHLLFIDRSEMQQLERIARSRMPTLIVISSRLLSVADDVRAATP